MINLSSRAEFGSQSAKHIRDTEMIPVTLYSKNNQEHGSISYKEAKALLYTENFMTKQLDLNLDSKSYKAITKDVQYHPVTDKPLHIDFFVLEPNQNIRIKLPLQFINKQNSPGIKLGGILNVLTKALTVKVSSNNIPTSIQINLTGRQINDSIKLKDLDIPSDAQVLKLSPSTTLATIIAPSKPKE